MLKPESIVWLVFECNESTMDERYRLFTTKDLALEFLKKSCKTDNLRLVPCNDDSEYTVYCDDDTVEHAVIIQRYIHTDLQYVWLGL